MLVPIGNDEGLRRVPWLTAALALLCVAAQIYQSAGGPDDAEVLAALDRRMQAEEAYQNTPEGSDDAIAAEREIEDSEHALRALARKIPIIRFGYRPVDGISFRMVSAAFVHGGWAHLIGNLLFLWLVAGNLEDRWGRSVFLGVFLLGAVASSGAYGWVHRGETTLLVGASGAIAAAMGAFLVCFARANIRYAYLVVGFGFGFRAGTFEVPAFVAFPVWLLGQLLFAWFESSGYSGGVAYSAHVGGFAFGVAAALALRHSGVEARYLLPMTAKGVEWHEDPDFVRACELGQAREALPLLEQVLARNPRHAGAHRMRVDIGVATGDDALIGAELSTGLAQLTADRRPLEIVELYRKLEQRPVPVSERGLLQIVDAAVEIGDSRLGIHAIGRLLTTYPASSFAGAALWRGAQIQEKEGRPDLVRRTLERMIHDHPHDPYVVDARKKLAQLG